MTSLSPPECVVGILGFMEVVGGKPKKLLRLNFKPVQLGNAFGATPKTKLKKIFVSLAFSGPMFAML